MSIILTQLAGSNRDREAAGAASRFDRPTRNARDADLEARMEGWIGALTQEIATLKSRHAARAGAGGTLIAGMGREIAALEAAIGAMRSAFRSAERRGGGAGRDESLAILHAELRRVRSLTGDAEGELARALAALLGAQSDIQGVVAMIERALAALRAEIDALARD